MFFVPFVVEYLEFVLKIRHLRADCQLKLIEETIRFHHEGTKNELKISNHKGHKEHIGREARKIKFLRPLSFDVALDGELVEPRTLRLNYPKGTAIAVP